MCVPQPPRARRAELTELTELSWAVTAFEAAQDERVRVGERLRAILQGRAGAPGPSAAPPLSFPADADATLAAIRAGTAASPAPALDAAYRRQWRDEREMLALMSAAVATHPAWPWLERVHGVGTTLAARLLARLDVSRAPSPASFWAYCGLATVAVADGGGARVAQSSRGAARRGRFDAAARVVCHLVAVSLLRQGRAYKRYYREQRAVLDRTRPQWSASRRHRTALRKMVKLFLAHLWVVWREALALPVGAPHPAMAAEWASPWDMLEP